MKYNSELVSKEEVAKDTIAFHFKKPVDFAFKAGQAIDITLVDPPETDQEGDTRTFSVAASPSEKYLTIASRMRDTAFKRTLRSAEAGFKIEIVGPTGTFTLHEKIERPAVMLVGGIGITPFVSIIREATEKNLPHKIFLFYSNRKPEDAPFLDLFADLSQKNKNFTFVPTMTKIEEEESWNGEKGYITLEMIDRYVPERNNALYYSAGPLVMVAAMKKMLNESGISDDDIKLEEFAGY